MYSIFRCNFFVKNKTITLSYTSSLCQFPTINRHYLLNRVISMNLHMWNYVSVFVFCALSIFLPCKSTAAVLSMDSLHLLTLTPSVHTCPDSSCSISLSLSKSPSSLLEPTLLLWRQAKCCGMLLSAGVVLNP